MLMQQIKLQTTDRSLSYRINAQQRQLNRQYHKSNNNNNTFIQKHINNENVLCWNKF